VNRSVSARVIAVRSGPIIGHGASHIVGAGRVVDAVFPRGVYSVAHA